MFMEKILKPAKQKEFKELFCQIAFGDYGNFSANTFGKRCFSDALLDTKIAQSRSACIEKIFPHLQLNVRVPSCGGFPLLK